MGKKVIPWTGQIISGIKVEKKVKRLFFLHTTAFEIEGGKYIFNYEDGSKEEVKLEKDRQISGWWNPSNIKEARVAWRGKNPRAGVVGFYLWIWDNPHPEKKLETIDVLCANDECVFILLGISAEKQDNE